MLQKIQSFALNTQYSTVKKNFVVNLYRTLRGRGIQCYILNDIYLNVEGTDYQFIHHKNEGIYEVAVM